MPNRNLDRLFLASIVESSQDSIVTIDLDMEITSWNKAAEALYGYTAEEAIGSQLTSLTLPKDLDKLLEKVKNIKQRNRVEVFESERIGKDRAHMILEVVVSPVLSAEGEVVGISTIARDLTARRIAEKGQKDKEILQQLIIAQEDERGRMSRDLHDELGQQMVALRFAVERLKGTFGEQALPGDLIEIDRVTTAIDKSIDFLAWELRPAPLEGVNIQSAMANYVTQWSAHAGIPAKLLVSPNFKQKTLSAAAETALYRVMQEALNNIHKHAQAKFVDIVLEHRDQTTRMVITDDGRGFNLKRKQKVPRGLGLTGMKERATAVGGTLDLVTSPSKGTTVKLIIPDVVSKKRAALQANSETDWH